MIVDTIVAAAAALLRGVLSLVPSWSMPTSDITSLASAIGSGARQFQNWLPVESIFYGTAALIGFRLLLGLWRVAVWVYDRFPFKLT